jgi:hypothetical protein
MWLRLAMQTLQHSQHSAIRRGISVFADETAVNKTNKTIGQTHAVNTKLNLGTNFTGCDVAKWFVVQYTKTFKNIFKNNYESAYIVLPTLCLMQLNMLLKVSLQESQDSMAVSMWDSL